MFEALQHRVSVNTSRLFWLCVLVAWLVVGETIQFVADPIHHPLLILGGVVIGWKLKSSGSEH